MCDRLTVADGFVLNVGWIEGPIDTDGALDVEGFCRDKTVQYQEYLGHFAHSISCQRKMKNNLPHWKR